MTPVANIMLPARMSPLLALSLGRTIAAYNHPLGAGSDYLLSTFTALALLNQSWTFREPQSLEQYLRTLRETVFSASTEHPLAELSVATPYTVAALTGEVPLAVALQAKSAAMSFACTLASTNIALLSGAACLAMLRSTERSVQTSPQFVQELLQTLVCAGMSEVQARVPRGRPVLSFDSGSGQITVGSNIPLLGGVPVPQDVEERSAQAAPAPGPEAGAATWEGGPQVQVFDQAVVMAKLAKMGRPSQNEGNSQQRKLMESMELECGLRDLVEVPEGDPLARLYEDYPHFSDVLDFVRTNLALAACGNEGAAVRIPPILVRGEPGTGKTSFSQELAQVLHMPFVERDLSVTSEAFVISGMDSGWKGSKPGVVFDALVNGRYANPLILLNEIDKASVGGSHNSPIAPLYALLEPTSSKRFVDEFVPVEIDASHVVWVMTANEGNIPAPILSRLEVFEVRSPDQDECRGIAASIWRRLCERTLPKGHGFAGELHDELLEGVSKLNPRIMRKVLTLAAGLAAQERRAAVRIEDLARAQARYAEPVRQAMGFVSH